MERKLFPREENPITIQYIIKFRKYINNQLSVKVDTILLKTLQDATDYIFTNLKSNHTVLLSPGTSSFSSYKDFEHRGNHFKTLVNNYVHRKN